MLLLPKLNAFMTIKIILDLENHPQLLLMRI